MKFHTKAELTGQESSRNVIIKMTNFKNFASRIISTCALLMIAFSQSIQCDRTRAENEAKLNKSEHLDLFQDQSAQEQRLAVQIITTDGRGPNEFAYSSTQDGDFIQLDKAADSSSEQQQQQEQEQKQQQQQQQQHHQLKFGPPKGQRGETSFADQYAQLDQRAYERQVVDRQQEQARVNSTNHRIMPRRIVINLSSLAAAATASEGGEENIGQVLVGGSNHQRPQLANGNKVNARLSIGPQFVDNGSTSAAKSFVAQKSSGVHESNRTRSMEANQINRSRNSNALDKRRSSNSINQTNQQHQKPPQKMRQAILRALSNQGGVPAMVMDENYMNQMMANGGEMEIVERNSGNKMTKLMLNAEMIDRMQQQQQQQQSHERLRDNDNQNINVLESELTNNGIGNHRQNPLVFNLNSIERDNNNEQQRHEHRQSNKIISLQQVRAKDTNAIKQQQQTIRPSGTSARSARSSGNINRQASGGGAATSSSSTTTTTTTTTTSTTTTAKPILLNRNRPAAAAAAAVTAARPMDERVARLLNRLKLYTTKEHLIKVARDLESNTPSVANQQVDEFSARNTIDLNEFQTMQPIQGNGRQQIQSVPMIELDDSQIGPNGMQQQQQVAPVMLLASTVPARYERRARHLTRSRVPGPIKYDELQEPQQQTVELFEPNSSLEHNRPARRINDLENLLDDSQQHQMLDLRTESSERGTNLDEEGDNLTNEFHNRALNLKRSFYDNEGGESKTRQGQSSSPEELEEPYENDNQQQQQQQQSGDSAEQTLDRKENVEDQNGGQELARPEDELERVSRSEKDFDRSEDGEDDRSMAESKEEDQLQQQQPPEESIANDDEQQPEVAEQQQQQQQQPDEFESKASRSRAQMQQDDDRTPEQEISALEQVIDELIARERNEKDRKKSLQQNENQKSNDVHHSHYNNDNNDDNAEQKAKSA